MKTLVELNNDAGVDFTRSDLILPYAEFEARARQLGPMLTVRDRLWLQAWELWDLAVSPMPDEERRLIRYGHYLGYGDFIQQCSEDAVIVPRETADELLERLGEHMTYSYDEGDSRGEHNNESVIAAYDKLRACIPRP